MGSIRELSKAQLQYVQFSFLMKYFNSVDAINKCILCNTGLYCTDWLCLCSVSDHTPFLWHRWFSPPVNLVFLTYYWVQSAPCLQRTSVTLWAPVWMAQKGCLLPAQACSSSTSIRTMDNVSNPTHTARISVIRVYLWFHAPCLHHVSPLSCVCPVQCSTATRSRPVFTWLVPVPYPCSSPSSTVPEPSTSAGTTWQMLSGQYTAKHPQFHGRKSLWQHHEGSHLPGQQMIFFSFNFQFVWNIQGWSLLSQ